MKTSVYKMPQLPMNYNNSAIYKICCNDISITDVYVGNTTNFIKRKSHHKCACNNERDTAYNYNVYQFIRAHGNWANWSMIVVANFPCQSKNQLHTRERYHMELLNSTLNKVIPTRTEKEYKKDNEEHIRVYQKEWYQENVEKKKACDKKYREENVEHPKAYIKECRKDNAEKIKEKRKPMRVRT